MTLALPLARPVVLVLMGVSGCGKTSVAEALEARLGWPREEGDALHPPANVARMAAGQPLTDADREPWLARVADWIAARLDAGECGLVTCSALKRAYRDRLARGGAGVVFVYLHGSRELIGQRLGARRGHFMPASLLDSQFAALQAPADDEPAWRVEIGPAPAQLAERIVAELGLAAPRTAGCQQ